MKIRAIVGTVVLLAAMFSAFVCFSYRRDMAAARIHSSSGSRIVQTPCGLIEYADVGSGPAIFAIHGAGGGFDQSLDLAQDFLGAGFRVVAPSRFGYFRTPLPADASPEAQADAHACLLDALKLHQAVVIGGSMGAPSALQLCLRHPRRCSALVLLFPIAYVPHPANEPPPQHSAAAQFTATTLLQSDFAFWAAAKVAPAVMMQTILATPPADVRSAPEDEQNRVLQTLRRVLPVSEREKGLTNDMAVAPSVPRYELERITVPTLVISAQDDLFGTFERGRYTAEHIPRARFVGYSTGGHLLVGHRTAVHDEVTAFVKLLGKSENP
jgi:2-hydroxy-6-oxonona-2,4-dienedioate hydrolase